MPTLTEIRGSYPFSSTIPPEAEFTTIAQRTDGTYLVDVKFNLWKDGGHHKYGVEKYGLEKYGPDDYVYNSILVNAHYSKDGGVTWEIPTPQTYDRKHTAISPMSIVASKREFDFVWNAFFDLPDNFVGNIIFRYEFSGSNTVIITSSQIAVSTNVVVSPQYLTTTRKSSYKIDDFLGRGPVAPWERGPADFMMASGSPLLASAVRMILSTRAATDRWGGECPWSPDFGSLFWTLKHAPGDDITEDNAKGFAEFALGWDKRIIFYDAKVRYEEIKNGGKAMYITVIYDLVTNNVEGNKVVISNLETIKIEVI